MSQAVPVAVELEHVALQFMRDDLVRAYLPLNKLLVPVSVQALVGPQQTRPPTTSISSGATHKRHK